MDIEASRVAQLATAAARPRLRSEKRSFRSIWRQHWLMYVMLLPAATLLILFRLYPLWGISIAFVDYNPVKGLAGSEFVGLENFSTILGMRQALSIFRNTVSIAVGKIILGQVTAVIFALLLFQVTYKPFRRTMQVISALPHFMSWVIIGGIMTQILASKGLVNMALQALGLPAVRFLGDTRIFPWTLILSETWKEFGFGSVIYLAALTSISPDLYEAAAVDGAGRGARLRYITIPGIAPTIILMSCLSLGRVLDAGFDQILVLLNPVVYETGDIIDTFVYRVGLLGGSWSIGTSLGLLKSVVGFGMVLLSYWLADKLANYRIF